VKKVMDCCVQGDRACNTQRDLMVETRRDALRSRQRTIYELGSGLKDEKRRGLLEGGGP
jgi:hypothetical protein